MAQHAARTSLTGSTLVRLLAGLIDPQKRVRDSRLSFADALNQWTGWTDSIALSAALDRPVAVPPAPAALGADGTSFGPDRHGAEQAECVRVRTQLAQAVGREVAAAGRGALEAGMGFSPFRHCLLARQQAMESAIGPLRDRVRAALAGCSAEAARLAAVDAVMAGVLETAERRLLATVSGLLAQHFARLCSADAEADGGDGAGLPDEDARREMFREDLQTVLLAELELRLQPVQGLLAALRQHQTQGGS